ncbi:hypothetical protein NQZ68_015983 [Dissostichus eleginoides]|nr:hypothetical protein NQZ68_015983 [Dissostichus eleginoides]
MDAANCSSSGVPMGANCSRRPQIQTRAQMFHPGDVWRLVVHSFLSDAHLTAGAGSHHVSLLRTSQTPTTLHPS